MGRSIFGIILVLIGLGIAAFGAYPLWLEISEMKVRRDDLAGTLARVEALAKKRNEIAATYDSIAPEDIAKLNEFFPRTPDSGVLLLNIDDLAVANGMLLKGITMEEGKAENVVRAAAAPVEQFGFRLVVSGNYTAFKSFLAGLEQSRRLIEIDQLAFDAGEKGTKDLYEFSIGAHTFWKK